MVSRLMENLQHQEQAQHDARWIVDPSSCSLQSPPSQQQTQLHDSGKAPATRQGMVPSPSSPSGVGTAPSSALPSATAAAASKPSAIPGPHDVEPLIVFDWDDTMLASSWIQVRELLQAGSYEELPEDARRDLAHLEQSVIKCLTNARSLGTVIIITNAESGWVELSAAKFFVNLLPLLEGVPVVSARTLFEAQFPGSPLCWKSAAFAYMMHDHFLDRPRWLAKKVVSIGDSNEEKVAMRIASGQHSAMAAKAVKFIPGPDPESLACQLNFVTQQLASIVSSDMDIDIVLDAAAITSARPLPMHSRGVYEDPSSPAADPADTDSDASNSSETSTSSTLPLSDNVSDDDDLPPPSLESSPSNSTSAPSRPAAFGGGRPAASRPIPIPGQRGGGGGGGAEGGGDCVQPFPPSRADNDDVVGSSPYSCEQSCVEVKKLEIVECDGGCSGGGWGGGGIRSDGGGACGGRTCTADSGGGGECVAEIKAKGEKDDASVGGGEEAALGTKVAPAAVGGGRRGGGGLSMERVCEGGSVSMGCMVGVVSGREHEQEHVTAELAPMA